MSALGHQRTYAAQQVMSALPLKATAKADMPQTVMSALPLKADMCSATRNVCFGPIADIALVIIAYSLVSLRWAQCPKDADILPLISATRFHPRSHRI